jgi:electron transfer flavoprotein alpha subunit
MHAHHAHIGDVVTMLNVNNKEIQSMTQPILAITEIFEGAFRKVTYEVLSEARRVADTLGGTVTALAIGTDIGNIVAELGTYGADTILVADHPDLKEYLTETYTAVAADAVTREVPAVIIAGGSTQGKDLCARLAARINAPLATDCIAVAAQDGVIKATRPMYGGKVLADVELVGAPPIVMVRPNAMEITQSAGAGAVEALDVSPAASRISFIEKQMETGKVDLTEAEVVVSGGRGLGSSDYTILEALAAELDGAVGASRSAVDEGWRPFSEQVGQTGKVVSPNLYVACGISGAIQHLAGMQTSKVIVAINKDADAPIFLKADYGIVGNLFDIVPHITEEVKKLK